MKRHIILLGTIVTFCKYSYGNKPDILSDCFFISAGTPYGKGLNIAEIHRNFGITYRVYDYDRIDDNKKPRPLHFEKANFYY